MTGEARLTADLADLSELDLALSGLSGRTGAAGGARYALERSGDTWTDASRRANARFYASADGSSDAGAAAGLVNDAARSLAGAWGARIR